MDNKKIKSQIMEQIDKGKIKMHSRYWFLVRAFVLLGLVATSMVGLGMLGGLWNYLVEINEDLTVADIPIWSVTLAVVLIFLGGWFFGKIGTNYKRRLLTRLAIFLGLIILLMSLVVLIEKIYLLEILLWNLGD